MPNFGTVQNNLITNIIVAETKEIAETVTGQTCVLLPPLDVGIGWTYEGGTFIAPPQPEPITNVDTEPTA
jgi:hypothetical protein